MPDPISTQNKAVSIGDLWGGAYTPSPGIGHCRSFCGQSLLAPCPTLTTDVTTGICKQSPLTPHPHSLPMLLPTNYSPPVTDHSWLSVVGPRVEITATVARHITHLVVVHWDWGPMTKLHQLAEKLGRTSVIINFKKAGEMKYFPLTPSCSGLGLDHV